MNGTGRASESRDISMETLLQSCIGQFDALVAEGEICFDAGSITVASVSDTFKVSFRLSPTLLSKPVIVHSPNEGSFPDPMAQRPRNPFEDPDPSFVINYPVLTRPGGPPTHRLLINKFPVYRPQLLVTTATFKSQADAIDIDDTLAMLEVLTALERSDDQGSVDKDLHFNTEYMGIYNCGAHSGNSQPHKHIQLFPKPRPDEITLFPEVKEPSEKWRTWKLGGVSSQGSAATRPVHSDPDVPFVHFFSFFASTTRLYDARKPALDAAIVLAVYNNLLDYSKQALAFAEVGGRPSHNVIFTLQWMLVVPRRSACGRGTGTFMEGPQVNAAGMAGMVWMSDDREMQEWERRGIGKHLGECGITWEEMANTELAL